MATNYPCDEELETRDSQSPGVIVTIAPNMEKKDSEETKIESQE